MAPRTPTLPAGWLCDTCGGKVTDPAWALVIWRGPGPDGGDWTFRDFKIVHKGACDPQVEAGYAMSLGLGRLTGPDGLTMLLSWVGAGPSRGGRHRWVAPEDVEEYVDLVCRVQVPGYEQARRRFGDPAVREEHASSGESWTDVVEALRNALGAGRGTARAARRAVARAASAAS